MSFTIDRILSVDHAFGQLELYIFGQDWPKAIRSTGNSVDKGPTKIKIIWLIYQNDFSWDALSESLGPDPVCQTNDAIVDAQQEAPDHFQDDWEIHLEDLKQITQVLFQIITIQFSPRTSFDCCVVVDIQGIRSLTISPTHPLSLFLTLSLSLSKSLSLSLSKSLSLSLSLCHSFSFFSLTFINLTSPAHVLLHFVFRLASNLISSAYFFNVFSLF